MRKIAQLWRRFWSLYDGYDAGRKGVHWWQAPIENHDRWMKGWREGRAIWRIEGYQGDPYL